MKRASGRIALLMRALLLAAALPFGAWADDFDFHAPPGPDDKGTPEVMRDLAERVLPVYQDSDIERYLANLSVLQMAAGNYKSAWDSRQSLRDRRKDQDLGKPVGRALLVDLYARARQLEADNKTPFAKSFAQAFHEEVPPLNDLDTYAVTSWLNIPPDIIRSNLQQTFDRLRGKPRLSLDEALDLTKAWLLYDAYRNFAPLAGGLAAEENGRRTVASDDISIRTKSGVVLHALWLRPKAAAKPVPTLLEFTIHPGLNEDTRACAAHGYACVLAYTRGKGEAPGSHDEDNPIVPFEHDGEDARAVIAWIVHQPWSDGRVGMIGDGYSGFAAWAASSTHPAALKAIATTDTIAPGISFPMSGSIFRNTAYRWAIENTQDADGYPSQNDAAWNAFDLGWYRSGKSYRDLDRLADMPSHIFRRWLNHPSYDSYWRKQLPSAKQLAKLDIPVLNITGYYADGSVGSLWSFDQAVKHAKSPQQTLLIGPYDDVSIHSGLPPQLRGYLLDPAAVIDLRELRFQWLDHVFRNAPLPAQLSDHVNYEVMGSNEWRHVPSLDAMSNASLKYVLDPQITAGHRHLSETAVSALKSSPFTVKLADRKDAATPQGPMILGGAPASRSSLTFISDPLKAAVEISGALSGQLDLRVSTMDVDFNVAVYELMPDGQYLLLAAPYDFRASYAQDRERRHLLIAGGHQQVNFRSETITSRRVQAGSRIVFVIGVNKRPDREINYGAGNDVSAESIEDGKHPLHVQLFGSSSIELPVRR